MSDRRKMTYLNMFTQVWAPLVTAIQDSSSIPGQGRYTGKKNRLPTPVFLGFPGGSDGKEST